MASKITIFYSYSSADEKLRERLGQHLTSLRDSGFIDEYGTHQVDPGDVLSKSITTDLQKAQIILLLVSRNSLGSKDPLYQEELKQILKQFHEGKSRIIPILLRPYRLEGTPFAAFKRLPTDGRPVMGRDDPDAAFDSIAQSLETLIKKLTKGDQAKEQVKDDQVKDDQAKDDQVKEQVRDEQVKDDPSVLLQSSLSDTSAPRTSSSIISDEKHLMLRILPYYILIVSSAFLLLFALNIIHFTWFFFTILILCFLLILLIIFLKLYSSADWIETLKGIFEYWKSILLSRYYSQMYREEMKKEHQFFDVKVLNERSPHALKLEQVYIDLSVNSIAAHRAATNPFSLPAFLPREGHPFLKYISSFEPPNRSSKIRLVLMGTPGSGKTTLLHDLALSLAQQKKELRHFKSYLPVFLSLYDLVGDVINNPTGFTLAHAAHNYLQKKSDIGFPIPWFQRLLKRGHCFILLDGLNNISELATRKQIIEWIQKQMRIFDKCHFILTSRAYAYRDCRLEEVSEKEVQSFDEPQIEKFVQNWYLANEQESRSSNTLDGQKNGKESARDLFQQIRRKSDLSALAVNPLLLTMIANIYSSDIYSSDKKLPNKRILLYKEICEVFLGKRQKDASNIEDFSFDVKRQILQHMAYKMMKDGKRELSLKEVEDIIAQSLSSAKSGFVSSTFVEFLQRSGLLEFNPPGVYSFAHLAFQEFFAAMYMEENKLEDELISHKTDTWWRETICLYCALTDATTFIESCLSEDNLSVKTLELALDCEKEAFFIQRSTRDRLNARLLQHIESADLEMRRVVAEERLAQRLRQMRQLQKGMYIDTSLVSCSEYQIFLDERLKSSQFCQPDHWLEKSFPAGTGNQAILGVRFADAIAFCQWLTKRENGLWRYRLPTVSEAQSGLGADQETAWKEEKIGFWVQEKEVKLFEVPLSEEEIKELFTGEYAKAFNRVFKRALDFDYISAVISELDTVLKDSQKQMRSITTKPNKKYENARFALRDLKNALNKSQDRKLTFSVSSGEESLEGSINKELHAAKSTSFFNVRHNLQLLIDYFKEVSLVQSSRRKKIRRSQAIDVFEQAINKYLEIHVTFLILEQRLSGYLPAWEGILLVKERKDDNETNKLTATT